MNNFSDEVLARRLLARREQGYSLSLYLRQNNKSYSIFFTYFTFLIIGLGVLQFWIPFRIAPVWIAVTCVASCLLRDLSWVLGTVRVGRD